MFAPGRTLPDGERLFMPVPNYPSVLRVRLDPGDKTDVQFRDLEYTEIPTIRLQMTEHQPGERYLFRKLPLVPPLLRYKLFAAVRLRGSHGEPDLVRVFDLETPECHKPILPVPFASEDWEVGEQGHQYDLFYSCIGRARAQPQARDSEAERLKQHQWPGLKELSAARKEDPNFMSKLPMPPWLRTRKHNRRLHHLTGVRIATQ
jgi:hypothetical protein